MGIMLLISFMGQLKSEEVIITHTSSNTFDETPALDYNLATQEFTIDFGEVDGLTREEIREKDPEFYRQYILNVDRGHSKAPGGESLKQVYCRMRDTILEIAREHQGETIVIASHGTAIQSFLNFASGIPWQEMKHFLLYNVSVSCVEIDPDGTPHIVFVGDRHHVPEDLAFCYSKPHAVEP